MIKDFPLYLSYTYHNLSGKPGVVKVRGKKLFLVVSSKIEVKRVKTFESREPETIDWVEQFQENSIFYDIGANIGTYTLFAAAQHGKKIKTYSFEPNALNFSTLNHNIKLNGYNELIESNSIGITEKTQFSKLNIYNFTSGASYSQVDEELDSRDIKHTHGVFTVSLDDLCHIYKFPQPNYIKIDVDGIEMKILNGGKNVLQNHSTKSVLIEFQKDNLEMVKSGVEYFEKLGFELIKHSNRGNDDNYIFNR